VGGCGRGVFGRGAGGNGKEGKGMWLEKGRTKKETMGFGKIFQSFGCCDMGRRLMGCEDLGRS